MKCHEMLEEEETEDMEIGCAVVMDMYYVNTRHKT